MNIKLLYRQSYYNMHLSYYNFDHIMSNGDFKSHYIWGETFNELYVIKITDIMELRSDSIYVDDLYIQGRKEIMDKLYKPINLRKLDKSIKNINCVFIYFIDDEHMFIDDGLPIMKYSEINYKDWIIKGILE